MTTNVRDSENGVLATDSRWTIDLRSRTPSMIWYVDDADYQKIVALGPSVFMFAGDSLVIDMWKQAAALELHFPGSVNWEKLPVNGMAISKVSAADCAVEFEFGHKRGLEGASFAGSGAKTALECWRQNKDAMRAVATAIAQDICSGGTIRHYNTKTKVFDVGTDKSRASLQTGFKSRGYAMTIKNEQSTIIGISDFVDRNPEFKPILEQVTNGTIRAQADCGDDAKSWPEVERQKLIESMRKTYTDRKN